MDAERGLVVTDRNTVPVSLGDVRLTFGGALEIPGKVDYIHPLHNLAVVSYDPKLIGTTPVKSAQLNPAPLQEGATVTVVGMNRGWRAALAHHAGELGGAAATCRCRAPCSSATANLEVAQLLNPPDDFDGVLVDKDGKVQALWSSFPLEAGRGASQANRGVAIELVPEMLDHVRAGTPLHTLDVEFNPVAADRGAPPGAARCTGRPSSPRRIRKPGRYWASRASPAARRPAACCARAIWCWPSEGEPVTVFRDVERAVADQRRSQR